MYNTIHEQYMKRAIELAKTAMGYTSPNPLVGCVVVKEGRIISEACHEKYGEFHAERNALTRCKEDMRGATLYVTLEPCCHYGKTPPCTEIIIEKGIAKVYVGSMDSNPKVDGKGVEILREHGIEVVTGVLEEECNRMNEIFFHYIDKKTPYVAMKYAMTLDGKIASFAGDSKWITGEVARGHVQELRKKYSGILVGIGTVLADNPMLNCRIAQGCDPVRIICDTKLRTPVDSNIANTAKEIKTIIVSTIKYMKTDEVKNRAKILEAKGIEIIEAGDGDEVDFVTLMTILGEKKIDSVLVEGGSEIHGSVLKANIVNKVYAYIAPKMIGGEKAKSPVGGEGIEFMRDAAEFRNVTVTQLGEDILVEGQI